MHDIFETQEIPHDLNKTYLCLIPKISNANNINFFRLIGLCNTIYKVITKIPANRLKPFLDQLIFPYQDSFIKNRRASDNSIIIQELISKIHKLNGKQGHMLLKIDLEKAFERLEWSFVHHTLTYFKFPAKFKKILLYCISTSSIVVLVNGSITSFIQPSREIKQGDPISPYIFILCLEMLSRYINHQVDVRNWDPITLGKKAPNFSHLFFVDGLTLMARANLKSSHIVKKRSRPFL